LTPPPPYNVLFAGLNGGWCMHRSVDVKRFLLIHVIVLLAALLLLYVYRCPLNYFFHIPCLGCGVTRAHLSVLSLDLGTAFKYHPLFFTVLPTLLYVSHKNLLTKQLSNKVETVYFFVLVSLFFVVYVVRLLSNNLAFLQIN